MEMHRNAAIGAWRYVHSRPVAVDYGGNTGVVVFYGASGGMLHAINGNQSTSIGTYAPGRIVVICGARALRSANAYMTTPALTLPSVGMRQPNLISLMGVSQPIKMAVRFGFMRRTARGRMVYAFDASTHQPELKMAQGLPHSTDDTGCTSADFSGIGQTGLQHQFKSSGYVSGSTPLPMLIFGGGYDTCEDGQAE